MSAIKVVLIIFILSIWIIWLKFTHLIPFSLSLYIRCISFPFHQRKSYVEWRETHHGSILYSVLLFGVHMNTDQSMMNNESVGQGPCGIKPQTSFIDEAYSLQKILVITLKQALLNLEFIFSFFSWYIHGLYLFNSHSNMALPCYFFFFICLFFLSFILFLPSATFLHKSNSITGVKPGSIFGIFLWNFLSHSCFTFYSFSSSRQARTYIVKFWLWRKLFLTFSMHV